jgi:hypothetical protein
MKTEEQIQRIEEENLKLIYLLRAARAEIKKREGELAPLNFKLGEMQSYIDELEHLEKKVKMYENGNLKTPAEVKVKEKMKRVSRMYEKASIESSFYKKRLYPYLTENGITYTEHDLKERLKNSGNEKV